VNCTQDALSEKKCHGNSQRIAKGGEEKKTLGINQGTGITQSSSRRKTECQACKLLAKRGHHVSRNGGKKKKKKR